MVNPERFFCFSGMLSMDDDKNVLTQGTAVAPFIYTLF